MVLNLGVSRFLVLDTPNAPLSLAEKSTLLIMDGEIHM